MLHIDFQRILSFVASHDNIYFQLLYRSMAYLTTRPDNRQQKKIIRRITLVARDVCYSDSLGNNSVNFS